jgi:hypothetical protein
LYFLPRAAISPIATVVLPTPLPVPAMRIDGVVLMDYHWFDNGFKGNKFHWWFLSMLDYTYVYNLNSFNYNVLIMCHVTAELKRWGNSLGVIIPKDKVLELGLSENDTIDVDIMKKEKISGFGLAKGKQAFKREKPEHEDLW